MWLSRQLLERVDSFRSHYTVIDEFQTCYAFLHRSFYWSDSCGSRSTWLSTGLLCSVVLSCTGERHKINVTVSCAFCQLFQPTFILVSTSLHSSDSGYSLLGWQWVSVHVASTQLLTHARHYIHFVCMLTTALRMSFDDVWRSNVHCVERGPSAHTVLAMNRLISRARNNFAARRILATLCVIERCCWVM